MSSGPRAHDPAARLHRLVLGGLQVLLAVELVALVWRGLWMNVALVSAVMALSMSMLVLRGRLPVRLPYMFQILVVAFVFGSLILGEVRQFYVRFWWWDIALHFSSGLLLGMLGFMLIYLLNEDDRVHLNMRPGFMALFAFCFALALGGLWEIIEFAVDEIFGATMQKPMFDDPSGLTDTMIDLIVDALGALIVSLYGLRYMRMGKPSFIDRWIDRVARDNPEWFRRRPFQPRPNPAGPGSERRAE